MPHSIFLDEFLKALKAIKGRAKSKDPLGEPNRLLGASKRWKPEKELSKNQVRARKRLEDAFASLAKFHGVELVYEAESDKPKKGEVRLINPWKERDIIKAQGAYDRAVVAALRGGGLRAHPLVCTWLVACRGVGQKDLVRRARSGLEKDIQPPFTMKQAIMGRITSLAQDYFEEHGEWPQQEWIRRLMVKRKDISPITRQAFNNRVQQLGLRGFFAD